MEHQSESIAELAQALAKAQLAMTPAAKDSENPYHKSKYADLASVWEACRKALGENDLSVTQTMQPFDNGVCIITTLLHKSGQWMRSELPMKAKDPGNPQGIGSLITYGRRYSLAAMVGVVQDDDDAETAKKDTNNQNKHNKPNYNNNPPPPPPAQIQTVANTEPDVDLELRKAKSELTRIVISNNIDADKFSHITGQSSLKDIQSTAIIEECHQKVIAYLGETAMEVSA